MFGSSFFAILILSLIFGFWFPIICFFLQWNCIKFFAYHFIALADLIINSASRAAFWVIAWIGHYFPSPFSIHHSVFWSLSWAHLAWWFCLWPSIFHKITDTEFPSLALITIKAYCSYPFEKRVCSSSLYTFPPIHWSFLPSKAFPFSKVRLNQINAHLLHCLYRKACYLALSIFPSVFSLPSAEITNFPFAIYRAMFLMLWFCPHTNSWHFSTAGYIFRFFYYIFPQEIWYMHSNFGFLSLARWFAELIFLILERSYDEIRTFLLHFYGCWNK